MVEGLGRMIKATTKRVDIKGLMIHPEADTQTHQQFVDDTMLMGHPSVQEARAFKKCLTTFAKASGLDINRENS